MNEKSEHCTKIIVCTSQTDSPVHTRMCCRQDSVCKQIIFRAMKLDVKLLTKYLEEVVITLHYCHKWENSMNKKCYLLVCIIIILVSFYVCV